MTYREKLQQLNPDAVSPKYTGGVENCPQDHFHMTSQRMFGLCHCSQSCRECWDNEYKGEEYKW